MPRASVTGGVPHAWTWVFVPLLVLGLAVLFRVRRKELGWPVLGGLLVWAGVEAGAGLGVWQGTFIGAFRLTAGSRLFNRQTGLPATIIMLPAVMLLVPGVAALKALYIGQTEGLVEGLRSTFDIVTLSAAILGGVLLGDAVFSFTRSAIPTVASTVANTVRKGADTVRKGFSHHDRDDR